MKKRERERAWEGEEFLKEKNTLITSKRPETNGPVTVEMDFWEINSYYYERYNRMTQWGTMWL